MDAMRAMLDELMGKERNVPLTERSQKVVRWDDAAVCKYQLCGVCPSKLFKNTKSDLGPCEFEIHDDHLDWPTITADYQRADPRDVEKYERKLMRYLEDLIREMDRKIAKNKERADKESAPRELLQADRDRLADLKARAKEALEKAEQLAEEGEVDQAQLLQQQADAYNKQHEEMLKRLTAPEKTMLVCDICGVFINSTDNEQRRREGLPPQLIMDHLEGKQYLGWKAIRERQAELIAKYGVGPPGPPLIRERLPGPPGVDRLPGPPPPHRERSERSIERDRDRDRRDREMARDRDRDRPRDHGRDGRDYSRDRDRDYGRDRDRDLGRSSSGRDRDYDRYDRGRERDTREGDRRERRY